MECGTASTRLESTGLAPSYPYIMVDSPKDGSAAGDNGLRIAGGDNARSASWSSHRKGIVFVGKDRRGVDDVWNSRTASVGPLPPESANRNALCVSQNDDRLTVSDSNIYLADKSNSSADNSNNDDDISQFDDLSSDDEPDANKVSDDYCILYCRLCLTSFLWCILWLNDTSYSKSV